MESISRLARKTVRKCCAKHKQTFLKDYAQRAELLLDLHSAWSRQEETMNTLLTKHIGNHRDDNPENAM